MSGYPVVLAAKVAGEPGSGEVLSVAAPGSAVVLNTTSAVTINDGVAGTTRLRKIIIGTALAGTLTIAGFQDSAGVAQSLVLPIATPAGSYDFGDALADKGGLLVTLSSATDANRVILVWIEA